MGKYDFIKISSKEADIMKILWEAEKPLAVSEIHKRNVSGTSNIYAVQMTIKRLLEKGMIQVDSVVKLGNVYGRVYTPTMSAESYGIRMFNHFFEHYTNRSVDRVIFTMLNENENRNAIVDDLEKALMKYKEDKETAG